MRLVRLIAVYYSNATKPPSKIFFGSVSGRPVGVSTRELKLNPSVDGPARAPEVPSLFYFVCSTPSLCRSKYSSEDLDRIFVIPHKGEKFIFVRKGPTLSHLTDSASTVDQYNLVIKSFLGFHRVTGCHHAQSRIRPQPLRPELPPRRPAKPAVAGRNP